MLLVVCLGGAVERAYRQSTILVPPPAMPRLIAAAAVAAAAPETPAGGEDAVPLTNRIDWATLSGVEGGIPYRTTIYSTVSAGVTVAALNADISAASAISNRVIYFNAGHYSLGGSPIHKGGVTLRGAGTNTVLDLSSYIAMGEAGYSRQNVNIVTGYEKGSTSVGLSGAPPDLSVGSIMMITESNNVAFVHEHGYEIPNPENWALDGTHTLTYKSIDFGDTFTEFMVNGSALTSRASAALVNANAGSYFRDAGAEVLWARFVDDSSPLAAANKVGFRLLCSYCDEPETPAGGRVRGQMVRVTTISGSTVGFTPALQSHFDQGARVSYPAALSTFNCENYLGIEDMMILTPTNSNGIWVSGAQNFWISNVVLQIRGEAQAAVRTYFCNRGTVQGCDFVGQSPQSDCVLLQIHSWGVRVENCGYVRASQAISLAGRGGGHVVGYNYVHNLTNGASTALISDLTGHGAHKQWVLVEGNKLKKGHTDSIHGSASSWTFLRNWIVGEEVGRTSYGWGCLNIDSWNYHMNIVGNVLGHPAMAGWIYQEDAVEDDSDTDKAIYAFNYSGYNEDYTYDGTNALVTVLRHGNYDYATGTTNWQAGIATRTITNSYYLPAAPSWWSGDRPAIGPDIAGRYTKPIPAETRVLARNY
jgi:hypothetical protein